MYGLSTAKQRSSNTADIKGFQVGWKSEGIPLVGTANMSFGVNCKLIYKIAQ